MARLLFIHWNAAEAEELAAPLRRAGHVVTCHSDQSAEGLRALRDDPPDAVVIDLARLPSHGSAVGTVLRQQKATRDVPLVFVAGNPLKTEKVRALLPDAEFTDRRRMRGAVTRALKRPPASPVVPDTMAGYSGTPLPKKLGIGAGARVGLLGAPPRFERTLGGLPEGAQLVRGGRGPCDVVLLFTKRRADLERRLGPAAANAGERGKLWIAWPKQASGVATDLNGNDVRRIGLASGLVDFKVCAIDDTWSGLCFSRRRVKQARR